MKRQATVNRKTKEVKCSITLNLDGSGKYDIKTGIPFFNHMLEQFSKHGYFDLKIKAKTIVVPLKDVSIPEPLRS